jgi:hypothetical protein
VRRRGEEEMERGKVLKRQRWEEEEEGERREGCREWMTK